MLKFFKRHKILAILLIIVLLWGIVFMCEYRRSSWYSEEQHIKRVSKRIDNHFKDWKYGNGERYESYKVYPLYEKDDTLQYFLVEFEPFGFSVIRLNKNTIGIFRGNAIEIAIVKHYHKLFINNRCKMFKVIF